MLFDTPHEHYMQPDTLVFFSVPGSAVCISECLLVACLVHFMLASAPTLTTKMAILQALAIGFFYCSAVAYQTYCAFCDKSTKFGIHVDDYMTNKSR